MCGIVGVLSTHEAAPMLLDALRGWNIAAMTAPGSPR